MAGYLDLETWPRRALFDFFIGYANPYFNITAPVDVTTLVSFARARNVKVSLALHYFALRTANEIEPFRYRLKDGKVYVYDVISGGTTVLLPNETFAYAYYEFQSDFEKFVTDMGRSVEEVRSGDGKLRPTMRDDVIYHTTIPWISFTSFSHARDNKGRGESIPRIVFGKFAEVNQRLMMPLSVEVHHALVDGLHVGRFFEQMQQAVDDPAAAITRE